MILLLAISVTTVISFKAGISCSSEGCHERQVAVRAIRAVCCTIMHHVNYFVYTL